jgi:hypothetical protein
MIFILNDNHLHSLLSLLVSSTTLLPSPFTYNGGGTYFQKRLSRYRDLSPGCHFYRRVTPNPKHKCTHSSSLLREDIIIILYCSCPSCVWIVFRLAGWITHSEHILYYFTAILKPIGLGVQTDAHVFFRMPIIQINRSSEEGTRILKSFGTRDNPKKDPVEFNGDEIKNVCKPLSLSLLYRTKHHCSENSKGWMSFINLNWSRSSR